MTAISSWKGMAEMPKFKSSAPRGYGLWMSHYFWGGGGGGTTYFYLWQNELFPCARIRWFIYLLWWYHKCIN